jgi:hypothetical protein
VAPCRSITGARRAPGRDFAQPAGSMRGTAHGRVGRRAGGQVAVEAGRTEADQKPVAGTDIGGDGTAVLQQHEHRAPPRPARPPRGRSVTFEQVMQVIRDRSKPLTGHSCGPFAHPPGKPDATRPRAATSSRTATSEPGAAAGRRQPFRRHGGEVSSLARGACGSRRRSRCCGDSGPRHPRSAGQRGIRGRARQRSSAGPVSKPPGCPSWPARIG